MRPVSEKRKQMREAERETRIAIRRRDGPGCFGQRVWPEVRCDYEFGLDKHELLTRARGGDPTDPDNCVMLCRAHHDAVHDHPDEAAKRGLLIHSWEEET